MPGYCYVGGRKYKLGQLWPLASGPGKFIEKPKLATQVKAGETPQNPPASGPMSVKEAKLAVRPKAGNIPQRSR